MDAPPTISHRPPSHPRLAGHMRACRAGGQLILLDLRRGRYLSLGGQQADGMGAVICPAAASTEASAAAPVDARMRPLVHRLIGQGLLVHDPDAAARATENLAASRSLDAVPVPLRTIRLGELARFIVATARAKAWLRWRSLQSIVNLIEARQRSGCQLTPGMTPEPIERLLGVYGALQPLAFSAQGHCLLDSLVLLEFLHRSGQPVRWVIGVRTAPFRAHAWIQQDETVLNDRFENVRRFEPILVVCQ